MHRFLRKSMEGQPQLIKDYYVACIKAFRTEMNKDYYVTTPLAISLTDVIAEVSFVTRSKNPLTLVEH